MARKPDVCFNKLRALYDADDLSDGELREFVEELHTIYEAEGLEGFTKMANELRKQKETEMADMARSRAITAAKRKSLLSYVIASFSDRLAEGQASILRGASRLGEGIGRSVESIRLTYQKKWSGQMKMGLKQLDGSEAALTEAASIRAQMTLRKILRRPEDPELKKRYDEALRFHRDVADEMSEMKPGGNPGKTLNPLALQVAKLFNGINKDILTTYREAGVNVGEIPGYVVRQTHNREAILEMGLEQWIEDISGLKLNEKTGEVTQVGDGFLDHGETFKGLVSAKDKYKRMKQAYKHVTEGRVEDSMESRSLHFRDGRAWFNYNEQYGSADLMDAMFSGIRRHARKTALVQKLGPNPQKTWDDMTTALKRRDEANYKRGTSRLMESTDNLWKVSTGEVSIPGMSGWTKAVRNYKAFENMVLLGQAVISAAPDFVNGLAVLRSDTGENLFSGSAKLLKGYFDGIPAEQRMQEMYRIGIYVDDMADNLTSRFELDMDAPVGSAMQTVQKHYFKLTGLTGHTQRAQYSTIRALNSTLAANAEKTFQELGPREQASLKKFGISPEEWGFLRKVGVEEGRSGQPILSPIAVYELTPAEIAHGLGLKMEDYSPDQLRRMGDSIGEKLQGFFSTRAEETTLQGNDSIRAITTQGMQEDTFVGNSLRLISQFKGVGIAAGLNLSRTALSDPMGNARNWGDIARGRGDNLRMAEMIIGLTALGYVSLSIKEMIKGNTPPDPFSADTMAAALVKGGAAGLYGDFLLADYDLNYRNVAEDILGPFGGRLADTTFFGGRIANSVTDEIREALGYRKKGGGLTQNQALNYLRKSTPFANIWYLKSGMDTLIFNKLKDEVNPGWRKREMNRLRKQGQAKLNINDLLGD